MVNVFQQNNQVIEFDNELIEENLNKVKLHTLSDNIYVREDAS